MDHCSGPARVRDSSRGSVTAETAVVLPALIVILAAGLWAVAVVEAQLECADAARSGARAASRGEPLEWVRDGVRAAAPVGARVKITRDAGRARVEVSAGVRPRWGLSLPEVAVRAVAVSAVEPGAGQEDTAVAGSARQQPELPSRAQERAVPASAGAGRARTEIEGVETA
ncbi:TadE family type IV pilus minor pilin [Planobispora rosea]|uniref:TadE family type IV pilus minor pilin n=1 Tax=Planobispora rosea TaxID=35762 RepID=UPI00114D0712|nr:TadE family type IV pilus minor pilin [Planobispora rosea]